MRVIGGLFKRRKLFFIKNKDVRPMADRMKETLFNILGETVEGCIALDICAGSGSIGIEALSRGARKLIFIEENPTNCRIIKRNLEALGVHSQERVIRSEAIRALNELGKTPEKFDLVFLDPPYNKGLMKKILLHLDQSDILAPLGRVVVHHATQEELPDALTSLMVNRSKKIGQAKLSFLSRKGAVLPV